MSTELTHITLEQNKPVRGKITVSWKTAIRSALTDWRDFLPRSIVVASLASILRMLQGFVVQGFVLWVTFAAVLFAVHVSESARLQRKNSRYFRPSVTTSKTLQERSNNV